MTDERVRSKLDIEDVADPQGRDPDPWAEFRQIERLTLNLTQSYRHSLGKYSRFFIELENRRFFATHCTHCEKTYAPPRPLCPTCLQVTEWVELAGTGTLQTYTALHFPPAGIEDVSNREAPYILAYVLLDGADTLFPHLLNAPFETVQIGMRVRVHFVDTPVFHPLHLMCFVPLED